MLKEKISRFFYGRNGMDEMNRFLIWAVLLVYLAGALIPGSLVRGPLQMLALLGLGYLYWRALSKSIARRQMENYRFLALRDRFRAWKSNRKTRFAQRKEYRFFTCAGCGVTLRVPRGRGKIHVTCRKCGRQFDAKT